MLSALANAFIVVVLMLYFLASLRSIKHALYRLAPASVATGSAKLGDRIIRSVGAYVSGAFLVALCAGITTLIFLFIVGLGDYAVALAFVVALLDVIPMIGATIGAVVVTRDRLRHRPEDRHRVLIFYLIYQQLENYLHLPADDVASVDIPGSVTVIAALVGASLLGVVGALLADPHRRRDPAAAPRDLHPAAGRSLTREWRSVTSRRVCGERRAPASVLDGHELDQRVAVVRSPSLTSDHAGRTAAPPTNCTAPRQLAEQQPGEDQRQQHLEQRHERRQPRAEGPRPPRCR